MIITLIIDRTFRNHEHFVRKYEHNFENTIFSFDIMNLLFEIMNIFFEITIILFENMSILLKNLNITFKLAKTNQRSMHNLNIFSGKFFNNSKFLLQIRNFKMNKIPCI